MTTKLTNSIRIVVKATKLKPKKLAARFIITDEDLIITNESKTDKKKQ